MMLVIRASRAIYLATFPNQFFGKANDPDYGQIFMNVFEM